MGLEAQGEGNHECLLSSQELDVGELLSSPTTAQPELGIEGEVG